MDFESSLVRLPERLQQKLLNQELLGLKREIKGRSGLDFSSNDYLGMAQDLTGEGMRWNGEVLPSGATASRLLRGQHPIFEILEKELAKLSGSEAALFFPSGYQCNVSVLSALAGPEDIFYSDSLNHASLIDGMRLSGAQRKVFRHGDLENLRQLLDLDLDHPGDKWIVTESLFSMDGDFARLGDLGALALKYKARLIVDEAHATGLYGNRGSGWVEKLGIRHQVFGSTHTAGKALGAGGAWFACSQQVKDYLVNFSRGFIFSTAPVPGLPALILNAILRWKEVGPSRVAALTEKIALFKDQMRMSDDHFSPIIPVIFGESRLATRAAEEIQKAGFDVRAIRPPTVPQGSARLRITLHFHNSDQEILKLAEVVHDVQKVDLK